MKPTRATQPYRKGPRTPGLALTAMLRGRTVGGMNPADTKRAAAAMPKWWDNARRAPRKPRPQRPVRPPR